MTKNVLIILIKPKVIILFSVRYPVAVRAAIIIH